MAVIKKKIKPEYFKHVLSGKKKAELRLADFKVKEGDTLVLREWDAEAKSYTGRMVRKKVTYVGKFKTNSLHWPEEDIKKYGLQIISME